MELTLEQASVARACGFAFFPATTVQVQRLTMQKRIFRLDGQPFLATRDGTYWETHGTLMRLIEEHERSRPPIVVEAQEQVSHPQVARAAAAVPEMTEVLRPDADPSTMATPPVAEIPTSRRPRLVVRPSTQTPIEATAAVENVNAPPPAITMMDSSDGAEALVEATAPQERDAPAARQPRVRKPKQPRSVTVGIREQAESSSLGASPTQKNDRSTEQRPHGEGPVSDGVDALVIEMATDVPQAAEVPGGASDEGPKAHLTRVVRRPPPGQPKIPRWVTAGRARRGRLK